MYILLILFFTSLLGIIFMIGRKLAILEDGQVFQREEILLGTSFLEEWKYLTVKNIKKHGYVGLVASIRFYVRGTNFLKNKYQEIKIGVKNIYNKNQDCNALEKKENKFLQMICEYKNKIREIKHKIKKEEENNL